MDVKKIYKNTQINQITRNSETKRKDKKLQTTNGIFNLNNPRAKSTWLDKFRLKEIPECHTNCVTINKMLGTGYTQQALTVTSVSTHDQKKCWLLGNYNSVRLKFNQYTYKLTSGGAYDARLITR